MPRIQYDPFEDDELDELPKVTRIKKKPHRNPQELEDKKKKERDRRTIRNPEEWA